VTLLQLFNNAGMVKWPLGLFSILALGIVLERLFTLTRLKQMEERAFMLLQLSLEKQDEGIQNDPKIADAPVTQVMTTLTTLRGASEEALQQAADIAISMQRVRFRRYLGTLATIGSTAPFIGLFGTVLGVMAAFHTLSQSGKSAEAMAGGISEALSATAVGLLVAIPSVMFYNFLVGRVQSMVLQVHGHVSRLIPLLRAPSREKVEV
jgi:biopolymer transport protein ExbB